MCGIAGIVDFDGRPVAADDVLAMCAALVHRGPDDGGHYVRGPVGLGMRRLSIIDLNTGRQPVHNEDGSVWVVFNGEIYNFRELRAELEAQGHRFYTGTDTEAIVHLYEQHGEKCVRKMRGMFAFALWDDRKKTILLARDRLGKKPLYYGWSAGRLVFASELKSILQLPEVDRRINWESVSHLFTALSTPPAESIISGIHKLEPAHILTATPDSRPAPQRYWTCTFSPDRGRSEEYFAEGLRELLQESVRLRLVSDVPLGAFLSGGVDSSAVVATMARLNAGRIKTFSVGFREAGYNELEHARRIARLFDTDHHEIMLEPDALDIIEKLAWYLDEPFGDSSAIPTYMVSRMAAEHVTVLLSGDGGDEVFAGYDKYVTAGLRPATGLPPAVRMMMRGIADALPDGARGRNFLRNTALPAPERYLDSSTLFREDQKAMLFRPEVFALMNGYQAHRSALEELRQSSGDTWLSALQSLDLNNYLPLDILAKVDRMTMANSVEARAPLLDHKLVEFAATIPPELKLRGTTTKYILKKSLRGLLPDEIIDRRKHGFAIPLGAWFRGGLAGFARDLLLSGTCGSRGVFNTAYIEKLLTRHDKGRELDLHLWTLISFEMWCRTFLDRRSTLPLVRSSEAKASSSPRPHSSAAEAYAP
jgi:asparagine synthase (glutamine-hydrolysing)